MQYKDIPACMKDTHQALSEEVRNAIAKIKSVDKENVGEKSLFCFMLHYGPVYVTASDLAKPETFRTRMIEEARDPIFPLTKPEEWDDFLRVVLCNQKTLFDF